MTSTVAPRFVDDDTARRLTVARVLLERARDDLEQLDHHPGVGEVALLVALALEELER